MLKTKPSTMFYFVMSRRNIACLALCVMLAALTGCQRSRERVTVTAKQEPPPPVVVAPPAEKPRDDPAPPPPLEPPPDPPVRWLVVEKTLAGVGKVTSRGEFDARRNKISVNVEGVEEFSLYIDRMPIDWDRLVVLSINGENSELRWRDYSPILFRRDRYGLWSVVEP